MYFETFDPSFHILSTHANIFDTFVTIYDLTCKKVAKCDKVVSVR